MLRATLKSLWARKVRLVLSALSIVLGVAFVCGSLIFTDLLRSSFDQIIKGSLADVNVSSEAGGIVGTQPTTPGDLPLLTPAQIDEISAVDGVQNAVIECQTKGVFDNTKEPALAITAGARVFWDNTNRRITTTATGNFQVGIASLAALAADTTVRVWLNRVPAIGT